MRPVLLSLAGLLLAGPARATTIGPGNVAVVTYDTAPSLVAVDLINPRWPRVPIRRRSSTAR